MQVCFLNLFFFASKHKKLDLLCMRPRCRWLHQVVWGSIPGFHFKILPPFVFDFHLFWHHLNATERDDARLYERTTEMSASTEALRSKLHAVWTRFSGESLQLRRLNPSRRAHAFNDVRRQRQKWTRQVCSLPLTAAARLKCLRCQSVQRDFGETVSRSLSSLVCERKRKEGWQKERKRIQILVMFSALCWWSQSGSRWF